MIRKTISHKDFLNVIYIRPEKELNIWKNGGLLKKELKESNIAYLKKIENSDFILSSKKTKIHISYFENFYKKNIEKLNILRDNQIIFLEDNITAIKKKEHVMLRQICHIVLLDDIKEILKK